MGKIKLTKDNIFEIINEKVSQKIIRTAKPPEYLIINVYDFKYILGEKMNEEKWFLSDVNTDSVISMVTIHGTQLRIITAMNTNRNEIIVV